MVSFCIYGYNIFFKPSNTVFESLSFPTQKNLGLDAFDYLGEEEEKYFLPIYPLAKLEL